MTELAPILSTGAEPRNRRIVPAVLCGGSGSGLREIGRLAGRGHPDGEVPLVRENEPVYLPLGCLHRLANPGRVPVKIVEVQTGAYVEEDDILRVVDDLGRTQGAAS
jgi:hypothetical protein